MVNHAGAEMIISNAGVHLYSAIAIFIFISTMPPCVCSMTTDVELCTALNHRSASVIDDPNIETVTTSRRDARI